MAIAIRAVAAESAAAFYRPSTENRACAIGGGLEGVFCEVRDDQEG